MTELTQKVMEHSGMDEETVKDIRNAADGYPGFTYYKDTCEFYEKYSGLIWDRLNEVAEALGQKPMEMTAGFGCVDSMVDDDTFKNALAWFALEEAAHELEDIES